MYRVGYPEPWPESTKYFNYFINKHAKTRTTDIRICFSCWRLVYMASKHSKRGLLMYLSFWIFFALIPEVYLTCMHFCNGFMYDMFLHYLFKYTVIVAEQIGNRKVVILRAIKILINIAFRRYKNAFLVFNSVKILLFWGL